MTLWGVAQAGYGSYPTEREMVREIEGRSVDDWFTVLSEPRYQAEALQLVDDYVKTLSINVSNISAVRRHRKRLEKELAVTRDYLHAISMSAEVHLTREQWRQIYPHLDPDKLVDPPTPKKLDQVDRRVEELQRLAQEAREVEKFVLMDAAYPVAREIEEAFVTPDDPASKALIAAYKKRHANYDLQSMMADGFLKTDTFRISNDGNFVEFPKTGRRKLIE